MSTIWIDEQFLNKKRNKMIFRVFRFPHLIDVSTQIDFVTV